MKLVSELDLPAFDYAAPDFSADRYHQQLAETRRLGWLARSPLAYIYGIDKLPIVWPLSSKTSTGHLHEPDLT